MHHFVSIAKWVSICKGHGAGSGPRHASCRGWLEGWVARTCQGAYVLTCSESALPGALRQPTSSPRPGLQQAGLLSLCAPARPGIWMERGLLPQRVFFREITVISYLPTGRFHGICLPCSNIRAKKPSLVIGVGALGAASLPIWRGCPVAFSSH